MSTYPRKLPELPQPPRRYSTESEAEYRARVYRWRIWLDQERNPGQVGRPDLAYTAENEVQAWRQWMSQGVAA